MTARGREQEPFADPAEGIGDVSRPPAQTDRTPVVAMSSARAFDGLEFQEYSLGLAGCRVRCRAAGSADNPVLLLLHGGQAHGGWWAWTGAALADRYHVLIPDLSGFGDSGHRAEYSAAIWVAEIAELVERTVGRPVLLAGHSMGGKVSVFLTSHRPDVVRALVLIDTAIRSRSSQPASGHGRRPNRVFDTRAEAVRRFRLRPSPTIAAPGRLAAVAEQSVIEVPGGWSWKFDHRAFKVISDDAVYEELTRVPRPVGIVYGGSSTLVDRGTLERVRSQVQQRVPAVAVPGAFHHVPLDDPSACASALVRVVDALELS